MPTTLVATTAFAGTPHNLAVPAGIQAGDMLIACVTIQAGVVSVSAPAGWTLHYNSQGGSSQTRCAFMSKIAAGSETICASTNSIGASPGVGTVIAVRGITAAGITTFSGQDFGATVPPSTVSTPSVSPAAASYLLCFYVTEYASGSAATWTAPSGPTVVSNTSGWVSNTFAHLATIESVGAGATTTRAATPGNNAWPFTAAMTMTSAAPTYADGAATLTGTGTVASATGAATASIAAMTISGSGTLAGTAGGSRASGAASVSGSGTLVGTGAASASAVASTLSGSGSITASGIPTINGAASLSGSGSLTAIGALQEDASAALSGQGSLSAAGIGIRNGHATLSGTGSITVSATKTTASRASASGLGTLTVSTVAAATETSLTIFGAGSLTALASGRADAVASTITGSGIILCTAFGLADGSAALTGNGFLAPASDLVFPPSRPGYERNPHAGRLRKVA